jgi:2-haloacid dehalogenase
MARPAAIRTLVFDIIGTVVDEAGSRAAQTAEALSAAGVGPALAQRVAADWQQRLDTAISEIAVGQAPWRTSEELHLATLSQALATAGPAQATPAGPAQATPVGPAQATPAGLSEAAPVGLSEADSAGLSQDASAGLAGVDRASLARAAQRLAPWPDSAEALATLARSFTVVALSNASLAQLASMFSAGGLTWHCVLSSELVQTYKPDPAVYDLALTRLELAPEQTMMVAAHPWDLRAAASHGMRTCYIARPGEGTPADGDHFDLRAADLADLARILTG